MGTAGGSDNHLLLNPGDQELFFREPGTPQPEHIASSAIPAYILGDFKTRVWSILGGHILARYLHLEWLSQGEHLHTYLSS